MLCHLIPVIISDCASHDIRNTAYSTSLESAISNGSRNLQYTKNTAFPNGEQQWTLKTSYHRITPDFGAVHIRDQTLFSRQLPHIFLVTKTSTKRTCTHCATKIALVAYNIITEDLTLEVPMVTKINFLLTISNQKKRLRELTKWSLRGKCFDL